LSLCTNIQAQSTDQNYIKTTELLEPVNISTYNSSYSTLKKVEGVIYFDGFGKAKQKTGMRQSPNQKDVVQHISYDEFGRISKQFLMLPTLQNNAHYVVNAESQINTYYQSNFSDQHPYSESIYDDSPLNRVLESTSPGNTWQTIPNSDNDHTIKFEYGTNQQQEVMRFDIDE